MRTTNMGLAAILLTLGLAAAGDEKAVPAETSLQGEVVDLHCYLTRGARGSQHAGCANACIGRGVSPGFVADDGRVFLVLAERPFSAKDLLAGLAGVPVRVRGTVAERDGVRGFQLKAAERVAGGADANR
jgi:hypothetical protein